MYEGVGSSLPMARPLGPANDGETIKQGLGKGNRKYRRVPLKNIESSEVSTHDVACIDADFMLTATCTHELLDMMHSSHGNGPWSPTIIDNIGSKMGE